MPQASSRSPLPCQLLTNFAEFALPRSSHFGKAHLPLFQRMANNPQYDERGVEFAIGPTQVPGCGLERFQ
jgi:hypothetical protein